VKRIPSVDELSFALKSFEGASQQVPPAISAVKVGGVPSYKHHARGKTIELAPRTVVIHWIALRVFQWPVVEFDMGCGRGTYVRSLIRDLGSLLTTGGCLTALSRLSIGPFTLDRASTVDDLSRDKNPRRRVISLTDSIQMIESGSGTKPPRPS